MSKIVEYPLFVPVIGVLSVNPFNDESNGRIQVYPIRIEELEDRMQFSILWSLFQMIHSKANLNMELTNIFEDCNKYLKDTRSGTVAEKKQLFEVMQEKNILFPVVSFDVTFDENQDEGYFDFVNPSFCE